MDAASALFLTLIFIFCIALSILHSPVWLAIPILLLLWRLITA